MCCARPAARQCNSIQRIGSTLEFNDQFERSRSTERLERRRRLKLGPGRSSFSSSGGSGSKGTWSEGSSLGMAHGASSASTPSNSIGRSPDFQQGRFLRLPRQDMPVAWSLQAPIQEACSRHAVRPRYFRSPSTCPFLWREIFRPFIGRLCLTK